MGEFARQGDQTSQTSLFLDTAGVIQSLAEQWRSSCRPARPATLTHAVALSEYRFPPQ
jgi:hypothetical protein